MRYADMALKSGYGDLYTEFLVSGLELYPKEGCWLFNEQDVVDALFRCYGRYDITAYRGDEWDSRKRRFEAILRETVERALQGKDGHGLVAFAFSEGQNSTHRFYRLKR